VAAKKLGEFGGDRAAALDLIAKLYAKGSSRLTEKRGAPPSLVPKGTEFSPLPAELTGKDLIARAEHIQEAACKRLAEDLARDPEPGVPPQALFSTLDEVGLRATIEIFDVRLVPKNAVLVEEGSAGDAAFVVARGELDVTKAGSRLGVPSLRLARLGSGAVVGEMALLSRAPRTASVVSAVPSIVLVATKADLDRVAGQVPAVGREFAEYCRRRMLDNLARTNFILSAATPAERPLLVERFRVRTFEPGMRIVEQGAAAEGLYLIALGEVAVVHQDGGEPTIVAKLGPGEVVGEVALVLRRPAIAAVVAQHPTVTLFLPREQLMDVVKAHPKVFIDLYELAVKRDEETTTMAAEDATDTDDFVLI
jgi:CRP-like cAMP-binding protein